MNPDAVFKAYDIRGRTDTGDIDSELYFRIGVALVEALDADRCAVGRDCRASSEELALSLMDGLMAAGANVVDLGEIPTDVLYYYSGAREIAGAVVTASHNPAEYNGLKICKPGAVPVGEDSGLADIKAMVTGFSPPDVEMRGSVIQFDPVPGYLDHIFNVVDPGTIGQLRVAVDGGNGMAGVVLEQVFDRMAAELTGIYLEPDGSFPNHPADPLQEENLADLIAEMGRGDYDLGVAFDGDADRAFFIDDAGRPVSGSTVTSLVARYMLARNHGASIVHNLITSRAVPEIVSESGGTPIRTRVGHSFIKKVMADTGAVFGGEHSGHYYFADNYRADSGILAMLVMLSVMSEAGEPLSALRREVERYHSSGEINFAVADQDLAMEKVVSSFRDAGIDRLDGLSVDTGDTWFNLRASNTEPLLRLNVEGHDSEDVASMVERVREIVTEA
ncbi:MAG: phosphomannomutase/phosphoglucomutase [Actinobacteria bacterium]|nr:MAG: phosphomannomutase/phosphoglucomutase [Actinomycetota bacterium]